MSPVGKKMPGVFLRRHTLDPPLRIVILFDFVPPSRISNGNRPR